MQLDEIELSVEINGEGQVKLLGSGTKANCLESQAIDFYIFYFT